MGGVKPYGHLIQKSDNYCILLSNHYYSLGIYLEITCNENVWDFNDTRKTDSRSLQLVTLTIKAHFFRVAQGTLKNILSTTLKNMALLFTYTPKRMHK